MGKTLGLPYDLHEDTLNTFKHYPSVSRPVPKVKSLKIETQRYRDTSPSLSMASTKSTPSEKRTPIPDWEKKKWVYRGSLDPENYEKINLSLMMHGYSHGDRILKLINLLK